MKRRAANTVRFIIRGTFLFRTCLLLPHPLGADLGGISDPQIKLQLPQQPFKPARLPTGFHSHPHLDSLCPEIAVERLRFLAVLQSPLLQFPCFGIYKSNLLETRMVVTTYNHHVRLLSPGPWLVTTKVYPGVGADIVMESITPTTRIMAASDIRESG